MVTINVAVSKNKNYFLITKSYPADSTTNILSLVVERSQFLLEDFSSSQAFMCENLTLYYYS